MTVSKSAPWGAAWRNKLQAALAVVFGLAALVTALVLFGLYLSYTADISAYRGAGNCASPGDALNSKSCRYVDQASVLSIHRGALLNVTLEFAALPDRSFSTSFASVHEPSVGALTVGGKASAELWNGHITDLAGHQTVDNPQNKPTDAFIGLAPFFALLGVGMLFGSILMVRAAWRPR